MIRQHLLFMPASRRRHWLILNKFAIAASLVCVLAGGQALFAAPPLSDTGNVAPLVEKDATIKTSTVYNVTARDTRDINKVLDDLQRLLTAQAKFNHSTTTTIQYLQVSFDREEGVLTIVYKDRTGDLKPWQYTDIFSIGGLSVWWLSQPDIESPSRVVESRDWTSTLKRKLKGDDKPEETREENGIWSWPGGSYKMNPSYYVKDKNTGIAVAAALSRLGQLWKDK